MGKFHYDQPATIDLALELFGNNFHDAETVNRCLDGNLETGDQYIFNYTAEQLVHYQKAIRPAPILFIGCDQDKNGQPMTINWFRKKFPNWGKPTFWEAPNLYQYQNEPVCNETTCVRGRYYLLHTKFPDLRDENDRIISLHPCRKPIDPEVKIKTLKEYEQLENTIVYVFAMFLHYLATGKFIYPWDYVLCQEKTPDGKRIRVGYFNSGRSYIGSNYPDLTHYLGVAPGIKPII